MIDVFVYFPEKADFIKEFLARVLQIGEEPEGMLYIQEAEGVPIVTETL